MTKTFKNYWCVCNSKGRPILYSLAYSRKDSIANYLMGDKRGWEYWRDGHGLSVKKVNITITEV